MRRALSIPPDCLLPNFGGKHIYKSNQLWWRHQFGLVRVLLNAFALLCLLHHVAFGHTGQSILDQTSLPGHLFQYALK
jgi:hypothetical protein